MAELSQMAHSGIESRDECGRAVYLLALASVLVVIGFYSPFYWMLDQWFVVEEYSPGPAVPILCAIALWHALKKSGALPKVSRNAAWACAAAAIFLAALVYFGKKHPRLFPGAGFLGLGAYCVLFAVMTFVLLYSGFRLGGATSASAGRRAEGLGLSLMLLSLGLHFVALRGDFPRASVVAYVTLLYGTSWYLQGWNTTRRLAFPYALLVFMVPMEFIDEVLGVPLRLMATKAAVFLMRLTGLDVQQTGNWFAVGAMEFTVDAPCSGLKSLIALTALGATYAYVTQPTLLKKILLAACAVPIALLTNVFRLACVGIFSQLLGRDFAVRVFHDNAAVVLYLLAILILMSLDRKVFQAEWFKVRNF
jgi:exosortase